MSKSRCADVDGTNAEHRVMLYACSGASNVAEVADLTARALAADGDGAMFCLAALASGSDSMVQTARGASVSVMIDGCDADCGKKVLEKAGVDDCIHIRVTDLGIDKVSGLRASPEQVKVTVAKVRKRLANAG